MIVLATALYWVAIGTVCLAGSALVAQALRRRGRQERWVWAAGLAGSIGLPMLLPRLSSASASSASASAAIGPIGVIDLAPMRVAVADAPDLGWVAPTLLAVWGVASALLLIRFVLAARTVARVRRRSRPALGHGRRVRVTRADGPAVAGFLRPIILVPQWVLGLPAACRTWILRHEEEHIRGRDPALLGFVLLARVAVPWNPVVWLFDRSIRSAIETDCDRRTVEPGGDVQSYSEALLTVARGGSTGDGLPVMAPAFAERRVPLDHRIETVTTPRRRIGGPLAVGLAAVVALAVGAACEMPAPTEPDGGEPTVLAASSAEIDAEAQSDTVTDGPRYIPYDVEPRLLNGREAQRMLEREYPSLLKESGIGGEVIVWLHIDESGDVVESRVREEPAGTSGYDALDAAALAVADVMRFVPAMNRDEPTEVWVQIPITFTVGRDPALVDRPVGGTEAGTPQVDAPTAPADADAPRNVDRPVDAGARADGMDARQAGNEAPDRPRYIAYDVQPELANPDEVRRALEREYPPLLKEAGMGGEVIVWLYVSETGEVNDARLGTDPAGTSGHDALDAAALAVANVMEFTPALQGEKRVAVWVRVPVTFTVGR